LGFNFETLTHQSFKKSHTQFVNSKTNQNSNYHPPPTGDILGSIFNCSPCAKNWKCDRLDLRGCQVMDPSWSEIKRILRRHRDIF
jgi:hypothetical protein